MEGDKIEFVSIIVKINKIQIPEMRQQVISGLHVEKFLPVIEASKLAEAIMVLSIEKSINWEYSCLGLVSGQSISQKGFFRNSEFRYFLFFRYE